MASEACYFAYGALMRVAAMRALVPGAELVGRARLAGWRFACNHTAADGAARANVARDSDAHVWGALYRLRADSLAAIDARARGYERQQAEVELDDGSLRPCWLHRSAIVDDGWQATDAYRAELLDAARALGLPEEYLALLTAIPARAGWLPGCRCD